jgi:hypothetical protein
MAEAYSILGQNAPAAATLEDLFVATTEAVVSSVVVCNWGTVDTTFRIMASPAGVADANAHRQYFDLPIPAKETFIVTAGWTLEATDEIRCYAVLATVSFTAWGTEIT